MDDVFEYDDTESYATNFIVWFSMNSSERRRHGEEAYHWISPIEFALKPKPKPKTQYSVLKTAKKGFEFEQGDIHWPNKIVEGGEAWLIEQE